MATTQARKAGTGWIAYSGVMLIIVGLLDIVDGLWALDRSNTRSNDLLYADKLGGWGWFYLILGIIVVLAGIGCSTGRHGHDGSGDRGISGDRREHALGVLPPLHLADPHPPRLAGGVWARHLR